jgi:hypothetical protein
MASQPILVVEDHLLSRELVVADRETHEGREGV